MLVSLKYDSRRQFQFSKMNFLFLCFKKVGGYLEDCPPRPTDRGTTSLRFARDLKAGMYVTIEPGCYFISHVSNSRIPASHIE